jgi:hypothetical protein
LVDETRCPPTEVLSSFDAAKEHLDGAVVLSVPTATRST